MNAAKFALPFDKAFSLDGDVALITGGGSGLGLAMAKALSLAGARVILAGRRVDVLQSAAAALGPRASAIAYDVTVASAAAALVDEITAKHGAPSILINNAGNHMKKSFEEHTDEDLRAVLDTHVAGAFALSRAVVPVMKKLGRGNILFTASMASIFGLPKVAAYAVAKSAYLGLIRTLSVELGPHGIRVNGIAPGWILTDIVERAVIPDAERSAKIIGRTPLGRFGHPEEIGWAALYLCSPAASFVTGIVLPVDGGVSIGF
jgi:gluconate 5-dehydrogenase